MKRIRTILLALVLLGVLVVGVMLVRTQIAARQSAISRIELPAWIGVKADAAPQHLSRALQFKTVSHDVTTEDNSEAWAGLRDWLIRTYPKFHEAAIREVVGKGTLVYTWKGTDTSLEPIILMAHQDVVPVAEDTLNAWKAPPFSGAIRDGAVWGRGAVDDKGSLVALMEAAELLAVRDFHPRRTVILVVGDDEETLGSGARGAAQVLKARGVRAQFLLDEGDLVITDFPLTGKPVALIGIAEKGYATLRVTVRAPGGHSSAPPKDTGATTLARAVVAINDHGFPLRFNELTAGTLKALIPGLPFPMRMVIANDWLFGPMLTTKIAATPYGAAGLHTTTAPTMLSGSLQDNVLPTTSVARINYRIMPGDTTEKVMANARSAVGRLPVELSWEGETAEPPPVSSANAESFTVIAALASEICHAQPAPALITATTDSRYLVGTAKDIYRFWPISMSGQDLEMIHGVNEYLSLQNLEAMIEFYARLIERSAGNSHSVGRSAAF